MRIPPVTSRRPSGRRTSPRRSTGAESAALIAAVTAGVVSVQPDRLGLSRVPVLLHALSFRGATALGLATTGVAVAVGGRVRCPGSAPPVRRLAAAGALLLAAAGHVAILVRRGWGRPGSTEHADLVVVSLNTLNGRATPEQIAALVGPELAAAGGAVVALPETPQPLAQRCADLLAASGHRMQVFSETADPQNPLSVISLLVSEQLGGYRQVTAPTMLLGAVLVEPVDGPRPVLAAVHPGAPMPKVGLSRWRSDVDAAVGISRDHRYSIVAGDFNTTVDHAMMRHLEPSVDAATVAGRGAEGTWPARLPTPLAAPIDHVLLNGGIAVLGSRTLRVGRSDHRAVVVRLRLAHASLYFPPES